MNNELIVKKCRKCGDVVKVLNEIKTSTISCCGEEMETLLPNSVYAAFEKHIPIYHKTENGLYVEVNHVMEKEHFIEWIALVSENKEYLVKLEPGQKAECEFPYIADSTLYAYCNKHGLWKQDID